MKLGRKNLYYSIALAFVLMLLLVGYFVLMLPSLYVEHVMEQNLEAVKAQHIEYRESGSYENVKTKNPSACFSIQIKDEGDSLFFASKMLSMEIVAKSDEMKELFNQVREAIFNNETENIEAIQKKELEEKWKEWYETLQSELKLSEELPIEILFSNEINVSTANEAIFSEEYGEVHVVSDDFYIFEGGIRDENNRYATYLAIEKTPDGIILSVLPAMMPDVDEIRPVVLQSLPMLGCVILLLVLIFSQVYSKGIVTPIVKLVKHSNRMKEANEFVVIPMEEGWKERKDEVGELAKTVDELYTKVMQSYSQLKVQKEALEEENKRQEIFMRASSHQLKTPISAALLLLDGMINNIGKYRDREMYLPKVKEQLLSMHKMVEDVLYLNHCGDNLCFERFQIEALLENVLNSYQVAVLDKQIVVELQKKEEVFIKADQEILNKILDNLISNAVKYTPEKETITICVDRNRLSIKNTGVTIPEEILPHIFDPFVRGNHDKQSHGLGLYIAAYYAGLTGIKISIHNEENSVVTKLEWEEKNDTKSQ